MLDVETLYRECSEDLYRALRRRFDRSVPDALVEDACQAAWMIAWAHRDRISDESPMGWLVTVARHELLALLHKGRHELATGEDAITADRRCDLELALAAREALATLAALTANQRQALSLKAAGYSYDELRALSGVAMSSAVWAAVWSVDDMSSSTRLCAALRAKIGV
jgi:RNA polymerase sigma factor (sigma-70 family)